MNAAADIVQFDTPTAVSFGKLVDIAYAMYDSAPSNPTPPVPTLPSGMRFIAYIQMKDFFIETGPYEFYGFILQYEQTPHRFVMAIRGTSDMTEWYDDLVSMTLSPWSGVGQVGTGFGAIYGTLRGVLADQNGSAAADATPEPGESFAKQVARIVGTARTIGAAPTEADAGSSAPSTIEVTGHSLGSALATLYVAENALLPQSGGPATVQVPAVYTFASPRVGDPTFAAAFDALPITSWRIANELDVVTKLPYLGFQHVDTLYSINSGEQTHWSLGCWHSLDTYLHVLDPSCPLASGCAPWFEEDRAAMPGRPLLKRRAAPPQASPAVEVRTEPGSAGTPTVTVTVTVSGFAKG